MLVRKGQQLGLSQAMKITTTNQIYFGILAYPFTDNGLTTKYYAAF